jgi:hypothetical protein
MQMSVLGLVSKIRMLVEAREEVQYFSNTCELALG